MKKLIPFLLLATLITPGQNRLIPVPIPVVVRVCGANNNGVVTQWYKVNAWIAEMERQGCTRAEIKVIGLNEQVAFVYGIKVLIGERNGSNTLFSE